MDKAKTTPKDFFLWVGAMLAFYWSVAAFIFLVFEYIDYALPNTLSSYTDPYQSSIPYDMASIIVLFPTYVALAWIIRRSIERDPSRAHVWVRRWALIFTLFVAGITAAIDLITLLTTFLRGEEIPLSFVLKVIIVLLISAAVFMHFSADLWGYWEKFPARARSVGSATGVLLLMTIAAGFVIVGTPYQARMYRIDEQKISDLQSIQYQIINYWQHKQALPATLSELNDPISGFVVPMDTQTDLAYFYKATGALSFQLCAAFNAQSQAQSPTPMMVPEPAGLSNPQNAAGDTWQHGTGEVCFDRTIDPALYPPTAKAPLPQ